MLSTKSQHLLLCPLLAVAACANRSPSLHVAPPLQASADSSQAQDRASSVETDAVRAEPDDRYLLQPGDVIQLKFFYNDELNEELPIRPDGKISLQLVGDVDTLGTTPEELAERLRELYAATLRQPEVAVIVKEFSGRKVYVGGEVVAPGLVPMEVKLTALQAIVQAGGIRETAELKNVVILRNTGAREPVFMQLDLKADLKGDSERNDVILYPYDIVYVPKTKVAKFNQFVKQHITELVPISLVLGLNYLWGPSVVVP